jgi:nitrite reductase (NADH) small subunit
MDATMAAAMWHDVGTVEDIPRLGARVVATPEGNIAVFRTGDDAIYAIDDRCPHKQGPLSQGIVHGTAVTCPLHNWMIDLVTGEAAEPDRGCVRRIPARIENARILLMLPISHCG